MRYLVLIFASVLIFSCSKDEEDEIIDPCPGIDSSVKVATCLDSFFFDVNSYWIYKNTINSQLDCTYVKSWTYQPAEECAAEYYDIEMGSNKRNDFTLHLEADLYKEIWEDTDFCNNVIIDSLMVNGTVYYNVIKGGVSVRTVYYKENIGQLRFIGYPITTSGDTNDLINYQVSLFPRQ